MARLRCPIVTCAAPSLLLATALIGGCFSTPDARAGQTDSDSDADSDGTPDDGTPDDGTPDDGTPDDGTSDDGTPGGGDTDGGDTSGGDTAGANADGQDTAGPDTDGGIDDGGTTAGGVTTSLDDDTGDDATGTESSDDAVDEAPSVLDVLPEVGAAGVVADTDIIVTFSEAMDTASTEAAFGSASLGSVSFSWSDGDTVLTIDPTNDLDYATGANPDAVEANEYTFAVGPSAADTGGTQMEAGYLANFFSARRIALVLPHHPDYSGAVASTGAENVGAGGDPVVGDGNDNIERRGFIGFDISDLPAAAILHVQLAQLRADQWLTLGAPFSGLGDVSIDHVAAQDLPGDLFSAASLDDVGVFSDSSADGERTADVTSALAADLADGESHTQYRLSFPAASDGDNGTDRTRYHNEVLEVTYLLP